MRQPVNQRVEVNLAGNVSVLTVDMAIDTNVGFGVILRFAQSESGQKRARSVKPEQE